MEREHEPKDAGGPWIWVAMGCGGLFLIGLCFVPPAFFFLGGDRPSDPVADPGPVPPLPPGPAPAPIPFPAPVPAPAPGPPGPTMPDPPDTPTSTRTVTVRLTAVEGGRISHLRVGSTCSFPVTQSSRTDGTFWCNAQIRCGGELLYGGPSAGFFDCTLYEQPERHVVGEDRDTTTGDSDGAMRLDTLRAELEIRDDGSGRLGAFTVRATVTGVQ